MTVQTLPRVIPGTAVVLSPPLPIRVRVRVERDYGWRAWARTNPGPVSVFATTAAAGVVALAGIRFGFFVPPWWTFPVMVAGAVVDFRQRVDERRYVKGWVRK